MATLIKRFGLAVLVAAMPLAAQAMMSDTEAAATVDAMLAEGASPQQVVAALIADGRDAEESSVLSLQAAAAANHRALGIAGVCAATTPEEATAVATALRALEGVDEEDLAEIVRTAETFSSGGCAPAILTEPPGTFDSSTVPAGGGGVSPAS